MKGLGPMVLSDRELADRLKAGDAEAHSLLERQFARRLFGLILYLLDLIAGAGVPEDAEEILNDTFFTAITKIEAYIPSRGTLKAWLFTIARNKVVDHLRKKRRKSEPLIDRGADLLALKDRSTEEGAAHEEMTQSRKAQVQALRAAMGELAEKDRVLLELFYLAKTPDTEVARLLRVQPQSIPMLRKRARDRLKSLLATRSEFRGWL